jgi:PKD repeat protein
VVSNDGCPTGGSAIAGLAFYTGGSNYPASYDGALLIADNPRNCMWVMFPGAGGDPDPANIAAFAANANSPVDIELGPDGNWYYVSVYGGSVFRIEYGLQAIATAAPVYGALPLSVNFDGSGSIPAQPGDTLSYAWDLDGDGQYDDSTAVKPTYVYNTHANYKARLKVSDQRGGNSLSAPITISAGNTPPVPSILTPGPSFTWKVGDPISFSGQATDPEDGALPPSALYWAVLVQHCPSNCHAHTYQTFSGVAGGSFAAPYHDYPSYLEIQLTATDSDGLSATTSVNLQPQTVESSGNLVPDGRSVRANVSASGNSYSLPARASASYAGEIDVAFNGAGTVAGGGPFPLLSITRADGTTALATAPLDRATCGASATARLSFAPSAADLAGGPLQIHVSDGGTSFGYPFRLRVSETTLYSPRWSINGYNAFIDLQNTSDCQVSGNVTLSNSSGSSISVLPFTLAAASATQIPVPGALPANFGSAYLTHDGPQGAITGGIYMAQPGVGAGANFRWSFEATRSYGASDGQ